MSCLITIILPVYGRSALLKSALSSVYAQTDPDWLLHIADDGSDLETAELIAEQLQDKRVSSVRREQNIGLFANLNQATLEVKTPWQLILCSDDELKPDAIEKLKIAIYNYPDVKLILSSYESIDINGNIRHNVNGDFYDCFVPETQRFPPGDLLKPLLRFGSINGNITGLLIHQSLFVVAGPWRSEWTQSADWEWLIRASVEAPALISRYPIARVRVHAGQLSVSNQKTQREHLETLELLTILLNHPLLDGCSDRFRWAAHHCQFQLWNTIKASPRIGVNQALRQLLAIHRNIGLRRTTYALIRSLPDRLRVLGTDRPLLPPI